MPNEVQKIGWQGSLVKVNPDYQGQELPLLEEGERSGPGLKQASRCFQSLVLRADRAKVLVNRILEPRQRPEWFGSSPLSSTLKEEACCRKFLELNVLFLGQQGPHPIDLINACRAVVPNHRQAAS